MRYILFLLLSMLLVACSTKTETEAPVLIAHAGGALAENRYLNSKEALLQSIQHGFSYIELDLLETTDGDLLAAHDWKMFHQLTGYPQQTAPLSCAQARQRKILGTQTVLTSQDIETIFSQYPHIYLVTDKIENIQLLHEKFASFWDRIIVELKSEKQCRDKALAGIKQCAFWLEKPFPKTRKPILTTLPLGRVEKYKNWLLQHPNVSVLVYTVNDEALAQKLFRYPFVKGIYSDTLNPSSLQKNL